MARGGARIDPSWGRTMRTASRIFIGETKRAVKRLISQTAEIIAGQAVALAPVDTGNLKSSIDIDYKDGGLTAKISVGSEYAIYVEYGTGVYAVDGNGRRTAWTYFDEKLGHYVKTHGMKAQPFFWPAVENGERFFKREARRMGVL